MEEKNLDKDINVRSKLTDEEIAEEIINALKNTKKTLEDLREEDDDYDKLSLLKKINNSSLWLIQRLLGIVDNLRDENAELQKQVNELKERYLEESKERCKFEQLYNKKCHEHNIGLGVHRKHWENKVKQAVKDTAKEIYGLAVMYYDGSGIDSMFLNELEERYGVEVE